MNILVTGGAGYLGSVLVPKLLVRAHQVRVLDIGYFGLSHLGPNRQGVEIIRDDLLRVISDENFRQELLTDVDAVIHLAALSNDPSAELNPKLTHDINYEATKALALEARRQGVRFLFSSSCSVYGDANGYLDEGGSVNPLTVYAESKLRSDQFLEEIADDNWRPVILRNGTLFGYSPRMRFDLVINIFSIFTCLCGTIKIFGDGQQWRPFLHVSDCARAFIHFLEQSDNSHIVYNVSHENLRVVDLIPVFTEIHPWLSVEYMPTADPDNRNYRVDTTRMGESGFKTRIDAAIGAEQMVDAIANGSVHDPESIYYKNAKWLKELSQIAGDDHRSMVRIMETMAQMSQPLAASASQTYSHMRPG